jgi:hypothetical protein
MGSAHVNHGLRVIRSSIVRPDYIWIGEDDTPSAPLAARQGGG